MRRAIIEESEGIYMVQCECKLDGVWNSSSLTTNSLESAMKFVREWITSARLDV